MDKTHGADEERFYNARIIDKKAGIYNRFHIKEQDIDKAMVHIMQKYGLSEVDALTRLFSLAFDKKINLILDENLYKSREKCEYFIVDMENI